MIIKGIEKMLTLKEAADLIGVSVRYMRRNLILSGALKAKQIGSRGYRIMPCELRKWQEGR